MGDARPVHFKSFEGPISGGDGPHEAGCNEVSSELHGVECVEFRRARGLFQYLVDPRFQCRVESLEQVFKQQREQLPCPAGKILSGGSRCQFSNIQLKALVTDIVAVIDHLLLVHCHEDSPCHSSYKDCLGT